MTIVGILETFGVGWVYGWEKQCEKLGTKTMYAWCIANFLPIIAACAIWFGQEKREVISGFMIWIGLSMVGTVATHAFVMQKMQEEPGKWTVGGFWWELAFGNIMKLKTILEDTVGPIPAVWGFLIKGFIPHALIVLFVNAAAAKTDDDVPIFSGYNGYDMRVSNTSFCSQSIKCNFHMFLVGDSLTPCNSLAIFITHSLIKSWVF